MDTCTSGSNSTSVHSECQTHYEQCLGSFEVSPISTIDCVKDATTCFLDGTGSFVSKHSSHDHTDKNQKPATIALHKRPNAKKHAREWYVLPVFA